MANLIAWQILGLFAVAVAAFAVGYWLRSARQRGDTAALVARATAQEQADRERLGASLERVQTELDAARTRLAALGAKESRLLAEHAQTEAENRELGQTVLDFGVVQTRLEAETQKLREELGRARHAEQELEVERRMRREAERSEREAQATAERWLRELGEARKHLAAERRERAHVEQERDATQSALLGLQVERTRLGDALEKTHRQLRQNDSLQQELTALRAENSRLHGELAALTELGSVGSSADIDREELEVRLETAVAHMRRARREAEATQAEAERWRAELRRLGAELESARVDAEQRQRVENERQELLAGQQAASAELRSARARLEEALGAAESSETRAQAAEARANVLEADKSRAERELGGLRERVKAADAKLGELAQTREEIRALREQERRGRDAEARLVGLQTELNMVRVSLHKADAQLKEVPALRQELALHRDEQKSHLEAEQRLLAAQGELRALRLELEAAHGKLGDLGRLREDHVALREEHAELGRVGQELAQAQAEALKLKLELQAQEARARESSRVAEENRALRDELGELRKLEPMVVEFERLRAEHKRLRLDWELANSKLGELEHQRRELSGLRERLVDLEALEEEVLELRERERSLEAQLFAIGYAPAAHPELPPGSSVSGTSAAHMESGLEQLRSEQGLRSAALADAQGLLVASAGDARTQEGLAAFSALSSELAERARALLPLGEVKFVRLLDENQVTVACRLFGAAGEEYGLSTIGSRDLDLARADEAASSLGRAITTGRTESDDTEHPK
jgi:hypothetical protein